MVPPRAHWPGDTRAPVDAGPGGWSSDWLMLSVYWTSKLYIQFYGYAVGLSENRTAVTLCG